MFFEFESICKRKKKVYEICFQEEISLKRHIFWMFCDTHMNFMCAIQMIFFSLFELLVLLNKKQKIMNTSKENTPQ